ncbi:MAG: hypothetical protein LBT59_27720 [Clostridiales bacterium]|jgi:hypothetical protein|nr:hypothetical protein [Clostridiales bacterium]
MSNTKSTQLSSWERFFLKQKGHRDGKIGLPVEDMKKEWSSPWIRGEEEAFFEQASTIWAKVQAKNARFFEQIYQMEQKIERNLNELELLNAAEHDDAAIIGTIARLSHEIRQARELISQHRSTIAEDENASRLNCESAMHHANQRIAEYWHGLICKNAKIALPVDPPKVRDSKAEDIYYKNHPRPSVEGKVIEVSFAKP